MPWIPWRLATWGGCRWPAQGVALDGTRAYCTVFDTGLFVIDITNPALPVVLGLAPDPGGGEMLGVEADGNLAYVATNTGRP